MLLNKRHRGFTLLEILVALFIFSVISLILANALRRVIDAQSGTTESADRLRQTQIALLFFSRDIEQAVNRPVLSASGREEPALMGDNVSVTFTHAGASNPGSVALRSALSRTEYRCHDQAFWRLSWSALDQAPDAKPHERKLLENLTSCSIQYLDSDLRWSVGWPVPGRRNAPLPKAVKINFTIQQWGTISQLYVIAAQPKNANAKPTSTPASTNPEP